MSPETPFDPSRALTELRQLVHDEPSMEGWDRILDVLAGWPEASAEREVASRYVEPYLTAWVEALGETLGACAPLPDDVHDEDAMRRAHIPHLDDLRLDALDPEWLRQTVRGLIAPARRAAIEEDLDRSEFMAQRFRVYEPLGREYAVVAAEWARRAMADPEWPHLPAHYVMNSAMASETRFDAHLRAWVIAACAPGNVERLDYLFMFRFRTLESVVALCRLSDTMADAPRKRFYHFLTERPRAHPVVLQTFIRGLDERDTSTRRRCLNAITNVDVLDASSLLTGLGQHGPHGQTAIVELIERAPSAEHLEALGAHLSAKPKARLRGLLERAEYASRWHVLLMDETGPDLSAMSKLGRKPPKVQPPKLVPERLPKLTLAQRGALAPKPFPTAMTRWLVRRAYQLMADRQTSAPCDPILARLVPLLEPAGKERLAAIIERAFSDNKSHKRDLLWVVYTSVLFGSKDTIDVFGKRFFPRADRHEKYELRKEKGDILPHFITALSWRPDLDAAMGWLAAFATDSRKDWSYETKLAMPLLERIAGERGVSAGTLAKKMIKEAGIEESWRG